MSGPLVADDRTLIMAAALDGVGLVHIHEALVAAPHPARASWCACWTTGAPPCRSSASTTQAAARCQRRLRAFVDMVRSSPER